MVRKSAGSSTFALPSEDEPPTPDRQAAREKDVVTTAVSASRKAGKLESNVCTSVVSIYFFICPTAAAHNQTGLPERFLFTAAPCRSRDRKSALDINTTSRRNAL
ncbi:MAG: hypothetical protein KAI85_08640 [Halopseudomonas aestusnigri]|nr:hypothetical protein [Halopseudomonas aestusnigri]